MENSLTPSDWDLLELYHDILRPFKSVTIFLQGRPGSAKFTSICSVLPSLEFLLSHLEKMKILLEARPDGDLLLSHVNAAWDKLDGYYARTEFSPVYTAAVALHPKYRWEWIEDKWQKRPEWIVKVKQQVLDLWEKEYKNLDIDGVTDPDLDMGLLEKEPPAKRVRGDHDFESWLEDSEVDLNRSTESDRDEYLKYLSDPPPLPPKNTSFDPADYWYKLRIQYPRLSRMAIDIMSIPAMSAEVERVFSLAGDMDTP